MPTPNLFQPRLTRGTIVLPLVLSALALFPGTARGNEQYNGSPGDVMLQGFHWTSCNSRNPDWYEIIRENAGVIKAAKFDEVWFPPPSHTVDHQGYMPTEWYELDTNYGTKAELKAAIAAIQPAKALADIVINHRNGSHTGNSDFTEPAFANNPEAVVIDDECGCGKGEHDSGDSFGAARDLDHSNESVQTEVKKWEAWLETEVGFAGWRYDLVKGYAGKYVGLYNDASKPVLSVGEFWDTDRQHVINWIDATGGKSMAFDFPTRDLLIRAVSQNSYGALKTIDGKPTGAIGFWPAMSVTFIDNHDTDVDHFDTVFPGDKVMQGYAYILTHPGIPCVFWTHFFDWGDAQKQEITKLIKIRKEAGLTRSSVVNIVAADDGDQGKYAAIVDDKVAVKIGPGGWQPGRGWQLATSGERYAVWVRQ